MEIKIVFVVGVKTWQEGKPKIYHIAQSEAEAKRVIRKLREDVLAAKFWTVTVDCDIPYYKLMEGFNNEENNQ